MYKRVHQGRVRTAPALNLQDHRPDHDPAWSAWRDLTHVVWVPDQPHPQSNITPAGNRPKRPDPRKLLGKR